MNENLGLLLEERLVEWEQSRQPQEKKMLECYQDVMRIPRDDDTKGTGAARSRKATGIFIGSSRAKVRASRAKINDALFGAGKLPFDTTPTNEDLAPYADTVEKILTEQLERGDFRQLLKTGVNTLATYGTGFIFGPFVRTEVIKETSVDQSSGTPVLVESEYEYDCPYFELGNTLDIYPDCEARDIDRGLGVFWVTMESPHTIAAWKNIKGYKNISTALQGPGERGNEPGSELAAQLRGNVEYWYKNDRIKVARFFGKVPKSALQRESGNFSADEADTSGDMVDVVVIVAGGVVVKVDEAPWGKNPALRCVYEPVEHEMWGVGVAENNAPHQKVTNAAFRLVLEGKGMALLGTKSVDRSKFLPTEDFKKYPGKIYQMKPDLTPEERKDAIIEHLEPDVTNGWIDIIKMSEQFSDDDTGITKYTQGDDSSNLNKTATGISMIMSASSLPIKEVIQNIDEMWIEPIVECLIEWNLKYLEVETVQKIHGDEDAQIWAQIKQFGKTSFIDWQATGTSSFMQKEVLTNKIRSFSEFVLANPLTASKVDVTELLQQTWDVMEIGRESPILDADPMSKVPPELQQQIQAMQQQIQQQEQAMQQAAQMIDQKDQEIAQTKQQKLGEAEAHIIKAQSEAEMQQQKAQDDLMARRDQMQIDAQLMVEKAQIDAEAKIKVAILTQQAEQQIADMQAVVETEKEDQDMKDTAEIKQILAELMTGFSLLAEKITEPKQSIVKIVKQPDGSFVGTKTEG